MRFEFGDYRVFGPAGVYDFEFKVQPGWEK